MSATERGKRHSDSVRHQLEAVGFDLVRTEVSAPGAGKRTVLADVVAWAADADGEIRPYAAVEVKPKGDPATIEAALAQLSMARDMLGTTAHYVVADGRWHEADAGLRHTQLVAGPPAPPPFDPAVVADIEVATQLLTQRVWEHADKARGLAPSGETTMLQGMLDELASTNGRLPFGRHAVVVPPSVLWTATQRVARWALSRARYAGEHTTIPDLTTPMACLLGRDIRGTVFDPFAGIGSSLWAAAEWALRDIDTGPTPVQDIELRGIEINADTYALARGLGDLSPYTLHIELGDAFQTSPAGEAAYVISDPPAGLRLHSPYRLEGVGDTTDGDLAAIDVALRSLRPCGRAVLHLPLAWTFRPGAAARYRAHLLDVATVTAIIGLPAGAYPGSSIPSVLLVLDNMPGTDETFVAHLDEDWPTQLAPDGAALAAIYEHTTAGP